MIKNKGNIKSLAFILLFVSLIGLSFAITIYSGESEIIELEKPFDYYSVVGNLTEVDLEVSQVGNVITIIPDKYSLEDSYEVIFFNFEKKIITVVEHSSGGTKTIYKDKDVIEYVDKEIIKYEDKEVEVEKEIEVEVVVNKIPFWIYIVITLLLLGVIGLIYYAYTIERGYENEDE